MEFLTAALKSRGYEVLALREPGGSVISEKIRALLLLIPHKGMMSRVPSCFFIMPPALRSSMKSSVLRFLPEGGSRGPFRLEYACISGLWAQIERPRRGGAFSAHLRRIRSRAYARFDIP